MTTTAERAEDIKRRALYWHCRDYLAGVTLQAPPNMSLDDMIALVAKTQTRVDL